MNIELAPSAPAYKKPSLLILGLALPGLVVGSVALGPAAPIVAFVTIVGIGALLRIAPSLNDRLYGGERRPDALLIASALVDHVSGRCEIERGLFSWQPYKRATTAASIHIPVIEIQTVTLQPQPGPQPSSLVALLLVDGSSLSLRVFSRPPALVMALELAAPP